MQRDRQDRIFFCHFKPYTMAAKQPNLQQLLEALLDDNEDLLLLDNLISIGEATFLLVSHSGIKADLQCVFFQLEKRFRLYARLLQPDASRMNEIFFTNYKYF
jgi:hypothetical protein